ncbi:MAG: PDZ domain-containing protein [Erysipelotrichales bacterium]|nr:PDZ domain-containing protein [Erysipelotrichales bacterium]
MKKTIKMLLISLLLFSPINVLAYSDYIIPGGENVGIEVKYEGVLVIGFYKINDKYNKNDIEVGDYITHVEDKEINTIDELVTNIENYQKDGKVNLTIKRGNKTKIINFNLVLKDNVYKTGLYIKDSITGIGTLTYIDPDTGIYGALGHEILESTTNKQIEVRSGYIYQSDVSSIDRSTNGNPGTKNAKFFYNNKYGDILKNTTYGIYGNYNSLSNKDKVKVAEPSEVKIGEATILTVTDASTVKEYKINITKVDKQAKIKNIYFEITDQELLEKTGGIVQGMSGSPIMQDGKIIGAVTHVVVENVKKGYGIFITTMLTEGERQE